MVTREKVGAIFNRWSHSLSLAPRAPRNLQPPPPPGPLSPRADCMRVGPLLPNERSPLKRAVGVRLVRGEGRGVSD